MSYSNILVSGPLEEDFSAADVYGDAGGGDEGGGGGEGLNGDDDGLGARHGGAYGIASFSNSDRY